MSATLKTADELKKLARMFQAVIDSVDTLERIGSMEQAEAEAKNRVGKLQKEADELVATVASARLEAQGILDAAALRKSEAERQAEEIARVAQQKADALVIEANDKAGRIIADAEAQKAAAEDAVTTAQAKCDEAKKELSEIEKKIESARARVAKILAG